MAIQLRSYQQILGEMLSRILAETDLTAVAPGSAILTILEAAASSDFTQEGKLLQLLKIRNVDQAQSTDLTNLAAEFGLTPDRIGAESSTVQITVTDKFSKKSTVVFAGAVSPAAGDTTLKIVDGSTFPSAGTIYIGRGTSTSEAIGYVSVANMGLYWLITFASALTKDHLVGEEVVLAQGGDRLIPAGTLAQVPATASAAAIVFRTLTDRNLPDGESVLSEIDAVAENPGTTGNVSIGKIKEFASPPFPSASVANAIPATGGKDTETDAELRQRIKDWVHNLGRGTQRAIIRAVIGTNDENKRVVSAFIREPVTVGTLGKLFIDDGTGFAPTFAGIGQEIIVTAAAGTEKFFQLQQFPLVKAQLASVGIEPFALNGGEKFLFEIDGITEERALANANWRNPGVVTAQEVAEEINREFITVEARAKDGRLFVTPIADNPDYIRCGVPSGINANAVLRFTTKRQYTLRLYQDDVLLEKNGLEAIIQSFPSTAWPPFGSSETLQLKIDGILSPVVTITNADFVAFSAAATITAGSPNDWAAVINNKFIGLTATGNDDGTVSLKSNRGRTGLASISVIGGFLAGTWIAASASSTGVASQFNLNRLSGQIELITPLVANDELKVGSVNTAGFVDSVAQSTFDLTTSLGTAAKMVLVASNPIEFPVVAETLGAIAFTTSVSGIQRITGAAGQFSNILSDDWCYLYNMAHNGLFRVFAVDPAGAYVDLYDPAPVGIGSSTPNGITIRMVFFRTKGMPQEVVFPVGAAVASTSVVSAINDQTVSITATKLDNNKIRIQTDRLDTDGALGVAAVAGTAFNLGIQAKSYDSNDPHIAALESGDLVGYPSQRITIAVPDNTTPFVDVTATGTPFTTAHHNRPWLPYLGATVPVLRQPLEKLASSMLTLRDEAPFQTVGIGPDLKATTGAGMEFGEADNMVFIIDDDATKKTFDIPMYVSGTIAAPSVPTAITFDVADDGGDLLGVSTRWLGHRFEDYRLWFQARRDTPYSTPHTSIRAQSKLFGPIGQKMLVGVFFPTQPASDPSASFTLDNPTGDIFISLFLGGGAERIIGVAPNQQIEVFSSGAGPYTIKVQFIDPVDLSPVLVGDILSLADGAFSAANKGQMSVATITNLKDSSLTFEHKTELISNVTVSGGTTVTFPAPTAYTLRVGDKITLNSITKPLTSSTSSTITVPTGGAYLTGGGTLDVLGNPFTYTLYTPGTGVFSGVTPDPTGIVFPADPVKQFITSPVTQFVTIVGGPLTVTVGGAFTNGSGYDIALVHQALTASAPPSFVATVDDIIQVAGQILDIVTVYSPLEWQPSSVFTFTGPSGGVISRLILQGTRANPGVNEVISASSSQAVRVFALGTSTASAVIAAANSTAGINDLVTFSNAPVSNGSGTITTSTEQELGTGDMWVRLQNGESFVRNTFTASPGIRIKEPSEVVVEVGEKVRLIPMTPENIVDHFNRKQISGLSIAANIRLVDRARRAQISSKIPGGSGQIFAVGGKASGANVLSVRNTGLTVSPTRGVISVDRSSLTSLAPGYTAYFYQTGRAKKNFPVTNPTSLTTVSVAISGPGQALLTFGVPLASIYSFTHTGTVEWAVRKLSSKRVRYEKISGTVTFPGGLLAGDWVYVGNGGSYAGSTPSQVFASANTGFFRVQETDNANYFDVDNESAAEEFVFATATPFLFLPYHSVIPGDQIQINASSPLSTGNEGSYTISSVPSLSSVIYPNPNVVTEGPFALGALGVDSVRILDQGFSTYRKVISVCPDPSAPTTRAQVVVEPGYDTALLTESQNAKFIIVNRLGFGTDPVPGVSGYQYWIGLKRKVQRVLDGYEPDPITFPGVRASGVAIEAREPQIQRVSLSLKVKTKEGVALTSISDSIKSAVIGFINSLGLGVDVVLSEIVSIVQAIAGVEAVVLVSPALDTERITIGDNAIARSSPDEIVLS